MAVYSFGFGKFGQLGQVTESTDHADPVIVSQLKGKRVISVSCGESHSLAVTEYGDLYTWGRGREGQLGHGDRENSQVPRPVERLAHERIIKAKCGNSHTVALTDSGRVYVWGKIHKLLEDFEMTAKPTRYYGIGVEDVGSRVQNMLEKSQLMYLAAGREFGSSEEGDTEVDASELLQDQKQMQEFGRFANKIQTTPLLVESLLGKRVVEIAAGYASTYAVTADGQLYSWGFNEKGQLGLGHRFNSDVPRLVKALDGVRVVAVAAGSHHTVILDQDGVVYTCGLGVFGQLGHGNLRDQLDPVRVEKLIEFGATAVQAVCGALHTVIRASSGELYSFGHGEYGQHGGVANYADWGSGDPAGKATHLHNSVPRVVKGFDSMKINHIACGQLHSVAVTDTNQVYTWGWGAGGCLGHGDMRYQLVPRLVASLQGEDILSAAAGWKHSLVIKAGTITTFAFDFRPAINNAKYSDIAFVVQNKKIFAHKVIVCHRCPHLRTMMLFHSRFVSHGVLPSELVLKGIRVPIFIALLTYLYTDHLVCPPHLAKELSKVAINFGIPRLASLCNRANYRAWAVTKEQQAPVILHSSFASDMLPAVNSKQFSDISFKLDNGEMLYSHRLMLASRSAYFLRMFEGNFKERDQASFNLDDGQAKASFVSFLEYIYTGEESIVQSDNAVELLALADRYIVDDLKQLCEYFLERLVSSGYLSLIASSNPDDESEDLVNACENTVALLEIGDKYDAKKLKRAALEAICESGEKNWQMLRSKTAFKDLRQGAPHLYREVDYLASKNGLIQPGGMFAH